jgi:hypothetical protein
MHERCAVRHTNSTESAPAQADSRAYDRPNGTPDSEDRR